MCPSESLATEQQRTFRGAKVRKQGSVPPIKTALHPQVEHYSGVGYALAMANRHKPWARRYLKAKGSWS